MSHKHAALMKLYYEDALETETPWERWEFSPNHVEWYQAFSHPAWEPSSYYRRKRQSLCVIEGKEVFKEDVLWHGNKQVTVICSCRDPGLILVSNAGYSSSLHANSLTWTKPVTERELWQWAYQVYNKWFMSGQYAGSEKEWREYTKMTTCKVRRLDHTRIEVEGD